jgi:hypothetical protein
MPFSVTANNADEKRNGHRTLNAKRVLKEVHLADPNGNETSRRPSESDEEGWAHWVRHVKGSAIAHGDANQSRKRQTVRG